MPRCYRSDARRSERDRLIARQSPSVPTRDSRSNAPDEMRPSVSRIALKLLEGLVHDVKANEPNCGVVECTWHSSDDLEAQLAPQMYGAGICLDDRVELHARIARCASPLD